MAKISDEIREWVRRALADEHMDLRELGALADRVDRETVELPRDRDGVPIHVEDTVFFLSSGLQMKVLSLSFDGQWHLTTNRAHIHSASLVTHTRPDSWERIADELDEQAGSLTKDGYTWQEDAIHDFADRIRKLAKREGAR